MNQLDALAWEMTAYEAGSAERTQHFFKVHAFARLIGLAAGLDAHALFVLEAAAYVHDIGIRPALTKYGSCAGPLQEKEGVAPAREMLARLGFAAEDAARVCFLVAHHHTLTGVDGPDWRILLEADFLVNALEGHKDRAAILAARETIFETDAGKKLLDTMYALNE